MKYNKKNPSVQLFLKSMLFTAASLALLAIGYFSASFFFG
jgi:hypothetical protein